jgi:hypothetical protein
MADEVDVDPVSGNEVPPGSLPEEVRDDIPARLSEGEYVVPADVLRFYGMKFFEDLRENAKIELARMDREGRIGGDPIPNEELSDEEKAELDSIGAAVGGFITGQASQSTMSDPYQQQQMMYRQGAPVAMGNAGYNTGGTVKGFNESSVVTADDDIDTTQPTYTDEQLRNVFAPGFSFLDTPVDSAATSSVILYGPGGEVVTLFLPAQQELYDEYIEKGYSTEQVKVTTETDVGQPQGGGGGSAPQQEVEDINLEDMSDEALLKTARGFGVLNNVATAVASAAGLPVATIVNTSMIAKYNDTLDELNSRNIDHGLERKGSIFGGESSLFDGLEDTDGIAGASFGDTWLGDLLGFDKKGFGVQGDGLRDSFGGSRRDDDTNKGGGSGSSKPSSNIVKDPDPKKYESDDVTRDAFEDMSSSSTPPAMTGSGAQ